MLQVIKLQEEVGELSQAIIGEYAAVRKEKDYGDAASEIADVVITTAVLAARMNIDLEPELQKKMNIIRERFGL